MDDLAIIFIYTKQDFITKLNLQSIKDNNPGIKVYPICQKDFEHCHFQFLDIKPVKYWTPHDIWYWGSDNIFLHWYLTKNIKAKNYLILEWDTYVNNMSVYEFFGKDNLLDNTGITGIKYVTYDNNPEYYWFKEQKDNKFIEDFYKFHNFKCITPLCGTVISDKCVNGIIDHISENTFGNKLYVETKFATIASYLGFDIRKYDRDMEHLISYSEDVIKNTLKFLNKPDQNRGMFHPIKNISVVNSYFKQTKENIMSDSRIHKAVYGRVVDVKESINKLLAINPKEKIQVNNFLNGDPAHGMAKSLYLTYEKNGQIFEKVIPENEFIDFDSL